MGARLHDLSCAIHVGALMFIPACIVCASVAGEKVVTPVGRPPTTSSFAATGRTKNDGDLARVS
jgi:hypothetical protein